LDGNVLAMRFLLKNEAGLPIQVEAAVESQTAAAERDVELWCGKISVEAYRAVR
jgi:hypothetical protein